MLKKSLHGLFDSDHPWSSPYGRYHVAPNFSPREIVNTTNSPGANLDARSAPAGCAPGMVRIKSKKWSLLRILALATFVHPAQHDFCFSSFSNHFE